VSEDDFHVVLIVIDEKASIDEAIHHSLQPFRQPQWVTPA
jgi:hypothetical protein